jgi:Sec-independent protein translocase protein TatA
MAILGAAALLLFGPEQLPRVMRKAGHVMREVQNTSQAFIREMERAADTYEPPDAPKQANGAAYDPITWEPSHEPPVPEPPVGEKLAEPQPALEPHAEHPPERSAPPSGPAEPAPKTDHPTHV